jgi:hypothetical protein
MKSYFYDNAEQKLYILDGDTEELKVIERLRVRVLIGLTDEEDTRKRSGELTGGAFRAMPTNKRTITCKNCGGTGHFAKKCPKRGLAPAE